MMYSEELQNIIVDAILGVVWPLTLDIGWWWSRYPDNYKLFTQ